MKITITAKDGYRVKYITTDKKFAIVLDGTQVLFKAEVRSYEDYKDEVLNNGNDMARFCECFITEKGNKFIYWRDEESDEDFISKNN